MKSLCMSSEITQVEQIRQKALVQLTMSPLLLTTMISFEIRHPYGIPVTMKMMYFC